MCKGTRTMFSLRRLTLLTATIAATSWAGHHLFACTGISLKARDGAALFGRTMEWGPFDLKSRLLIIPRGYRFTGQTPDGKPGLTWVAKYGAVGMDGVDKDIIIDGMNERGLTVGVFYHPGFAEYRAYDPTKAAESVGPTDVGQYLLTTCDSVESARKAMQDVRVVPVMEESLGIVAAVHYMVTEPTGKAIVIEFLGGEMKIFDAPLGVITNSPSYDWHETKLRNYINLSPVSLPDRKIGDLDFKPLGGGSGMIGLPGDFTPPSRFVRAVAFSKSARPTDTGAEAMYEVFRILDNFNVPLGAAEGSGKDKTHGMRSATQWTTCSDTKNRVLYYHTEHNRRVRKVELDKIDFARPDGLVRQPLDKVKAQDIEDITPVAR
jgi:choloylglycine hydrolase